MSAYSIEHRMSRLLREAFLKEEASPMKASWFTKLVHEHLRKNAVMYAREYADKTSIEEYLDENNQASREAVLLFAKQLLVRSFDWSKVSAGIANSVGDALPAKLGRQFMLSVDDARVIETRTGLEVVFKMHGEQFEYTDRYDRVENPGDTEEDAIFKALVAMGANSRMSNVTWDMEALPEGNVDELVYKVQAVWDIPPTKNVEQLLWPAVGQAVTTQVDKILGK